MIPAALRKEFGWKEGTVINFAIEDGQVAVFDQRAALKRFQEYAQSLIPEGSDVLEEFMAERRAAAALENRED